MLDYVKRFWAFLREDSWSSLIVSLILIFVFIRFIFFPIVGFALGAELPLVVVESCSMYHEQGFEGWWEQNALWYESQADINKSGFEDFSFKNGINKGDVILVWGRDKPKIGDVIIFHSSYTYPLIHRVVDLRPLSTKGDHNPGQLAAEEDIPQDAVIGKAVARIPLLGWIKLIFFEALKPSDQRGFCR
jgi:hypothetical protein